MDWEEKLKNAKTDEAKKDFAIKELYNLIDHIDILDINMIKRILYFIIGVLEGVFHKQ